MQLILKYMYLQAYQKEKGKRETQKKKTKKTRHSVKKLYDVNDIYKAEFNDAFINDHARSKARDLFVCNLPHKHEASF